MGRIDPPADFAKSIHQALRSWHAGQTQAPFADRLLTQQIYDLSGGNPLATKLLIGQVNILSLPQALALFRVSRRRSALIVYLVLLYHVAC